MMRNLSVLLIAAAVGLSGVTGAGAWAEEKAADAAPPQEAAAPAKDEAESKADSATSAGALEIRATKAMEARDWATALPLLKKVADLVKDDPDRLDATQERIRVCEKNIAKQAAANLQAARKGEKPPAEGVPAVANPAPPTAEQRKAHAAPEAGKVVELTIKELGNFDYNNDKGGNIPPDVQALNGHTVRVRGFMIPMDQAQDITQFALVPDLFACCFGQPPQVQHTIIVHCPEGQAVGYSPEEIVCEGKLKVEEKKDDGFIVSVFEMEVQSVKPAPR